MTKTKTSTKWEEKYRPKSFQEMIGNKEQIRALNSQLAHYTVPDFPNLILFSGFTGCGKTTGVYLTKEHYGISNHNFHTFNARDLKADIWDQTVIPLTRTLPRRTRNSSKTSDQFRIIFIDEAHACPSKKVMESLKTLTEDISKGGKCCFILATDNPTKLDKSLRDRANIHVDLKRLPIKDLEKVFNKVVAGESLNIPDQVKIKLLENAQGSARAVVNKLQLIHKMTKKDMLSKLETYDDPVQSRCSDIAFKLFYGIPDKNWNYPDWFEDIVPVLRDLKGETSYGLKLQLDKWVSDHITGSNLSKKSESIKSKIMTKVMGYVECSRDFNLISDNSDTFIQFVYYVWNFIRMECN